MTDHTLQKLREGHRKRLRAKYLRSEMRSFADYEVLEMLLFYVIPRADTRPIAKKLLLRFGSFAAVVNAELDDLRAVEGIGDAAVLLFKLLKDFSSRLFLPCEGLDKQFNVLKSWSEVLNYCRLTMGYQKKREFFRVLYLNRKNSLLADEFHDGGTIDRVAVYPREIARKVIQHGASAVILVHNHPTGDPTPSKEDITLTKNIVKALEPLNAVVHDHLIIAGFEHLSFRASGLVFGA